MDLTAKSAALKVKDKLYTLASALDEAHMQAKLRPLVQARFGQSVEVDRVDIEILRRRNQRCVVRYHLALTGAAQQVWRVIGKVYKANQGRQVYDDMCTLWRHGFDREAGDGISMPEPYDFWDDLCLLLQEEVPGVPVKAFARKAENTAAFRLLARTLVKLHRSPLAPGTPFTVRELLTRCHPRHEFLALALPNLAPAIDYLVTTAFKLEAAFGRIAMTPLHGDFHLGQVHLEGNRAWLIDYDALCYGDPASDLGNLLVFLRGKVKRAPGLPVLLEAFLDEYFTFMDPAIRQRLPLHEGLTHLRRACKCLRLQEPGWEKKAQRMIARGLACFEQMKASPAAFAALLPNALEEEDEEELWEAN
ncbi:MAG: aminoglycoside phosphotransferase family protein [candidate division KSB1 bacterium]|nr:aminoglycoside phosphotransferase family protein [candidate division KSB1 bacterium]MDZ7273233.1 aminoglycoside phosphotransferase family protein [candidate division KSB1 bacterium]MDZ7285335.1 aminoglycoside phosphotransferase family protein [candidate division KSB1 bacterium]MDZ7298367.1 aminoglycoside phosphotransferase family protein [candidate division KSB1 bacterium]MDZ7309250.1 aminoglycoside phosphotransferase family protein [candidate division KSB1 bacterium]